MVVAAQEELHGLNVQATLDSHAKRSLEGRLRARLPGITLTLKGVRADLEKAKAVVTRSVHAIVVAPAISVPADSKNWLTYLFRQARKLESMADADSEGSDSDSDTSVASSVASHTSR
jgi:hypothetical protein